MIMRWTCYLLAIFFVGALVTSPALAQEALPCATLGLPLTEKTEREGPDYQDEMPTSAPEPNRLFPIEAHWDNGLFFTTPDERFRLHVGGIGQIDTVWLIGPQSEFAAPGGASNGVGNAQASQIRRA